ncbi:ras guanine nucleotide exchange factor domain-containing protein [Paraphysoderma sedebokerense]|nr:ras guanine nucleotide exchange factor domain-containing protein [Paraphysoderma sedebokerense]
MPSSPEKEEPDVTNIYNSEAFNSSPSPTSPLSTIAAYSDTLNTISIQNVTSGGESFPSLERGLEGSLSQQLSNSSSTAATLKRKLSTKLFKSSEKSKNSIVSSNNIEILEESSTSESDSNISKEYTGTESADSGEMKRSDSDDIRHITMKALQRSPGDIMHGGSISSRLGRKRTSSSSAGQSAQSTTLRRSMTRGRTRTVSEGAAIILEYGDSGSVDNASPSLPNLIPIQILLPAPDISNNFGVVASSSENQPTTLTYKVGPETALENLLRHVCRVKNLLYDMYTLEDTNGQVKIEMDRTVNYYVNNDKSVAAVKEFKIVKKAKTYNLLSIVEGEKEVMIMQNVGGKFMVMAASEERLIERITDSFDDATGSATEYDYDYLDQFLMTYRSFMKPPLLFDYLMARFNAELPPDASEEDVAFFNMNKGPTQHRAVQALGIWAENYWHDFALNSELRNDLGEFIDEICQFEEFKAAGNSIRETIERQTEAYEKLFNEQRLNNPNQRGKMMESMLMTLKPEVVAQQLCLYDWSLFHNIHAIEYLNQIWRKKEDDEDTTPSLDFFIARFDQESYWVATEICSVKDLKKRTAVLVQFIQIARLCLEYNNFFSAFSLTAGLGLRPVERLKKTWKNLPDDIQKKFDELTKLCDPSRNMKNYRDRLAGSKPPVVPFLPIYLKDLTFLNDGNESKVRGLINFDKLRMMAGRVKEITSTVNIDYNFHKDPTVLNYLKKPTVDRDLNKLKELSLECEPNK